MTLATTNLMGSQGRLNDQQGGYLASQGRLNDATGKYVVPQQGAALGAQAGLYGSQGRALDQQTGASQAMLPSQVAALNGITTELKRKKIEMGNFIVTNETKLDALFRAKKISESDLIYYTNRYGLYQGELRNAILNAALNTNNLLSPQQVNKLQALKNHN